MLPDIHADHDTLARVIAAGATFFAVKVELINGACVKVPLVKGWQKSAHHGITSEKMLGDGAAFGFHPETIGAFVIDLDKKGDKDGEASILAALPPGATEARSAVEHPACYSDTPNGRHLYFSATGLPPTLVISKNGVLPGVDLRGHHSGGWLVAPGSVGWSTARQEWRTYTLDGDINHLPPMPAELARALTAALGGPESAVPDHVRPALPGEALSSPPPDPTLEALFHDARAAEHDPSTFSAIIERLVPAATWNGKDYETGDYSGKRGSSCKWTPTTGIIKDFAESNGGGDLLWWLHVHQGLSTVQSARLVLKLAGRPDPSQGPIVMTVPTASSPDTHAATSPLSFLTGEYSLSDSGNAERFAEMTRGSLLYNSSSAIWMAWNGTHWTRDEAGVLPQQASKRVAQAIKAQATALAASGGSDETAKALMSWAHKSESADRRNAMIKLAASEPGVALSEDSFDTNPDLFTCASGTIDLRTGELRPTSPDDRITLASPLRYSTAPAPRFQLFLSQILSFDEPTIEWMRIYMGYLLTGHTTCQLFPIWWGGGQNGKSVLLEIIAGVMGPYCRKTSSETWLEQKNPGGIRDDLASLRGARFAWASEPDGKRRIATSTIKEITGGDPITCRHLYGRLFTFTPQFKTALVTNHRPSVQSQDFGIWRRLRYVPFLYQVPEDAKIPDLGKILLAEEGPQILGWMVEAARDWNERGKSMPPCPGIETATADLREGDDILAEWIMERCVVADSCNTGFDQLWQSYQDWNIEKGIRNFLGRNAFKTTLAERRYSMKKFQNRWIVSGLGIKA